MAQFKIAHGQTKNLPTALEEGQVYVTYDNSGQNGKIFADVEIDGKTVRVGLEGKSAYQYAQEGGYQGTEQEFVQLLNGLDSEIEIHNQDELAHPDIREEIDQLANKTVDKNNIFLGIASDGLMHIFINGEPVGPGVARGGGDDVFGYVDENNIVVLSGNLPTGAYTIKYEMTDGSLIDIGNLVLDNNIYYSIINNLTNCTTSNNVLQVAEGGAYSATITANSGYELKSVTVTMGGSSVSVTNGVINIASVTGNIIITAIAEEAVVPPTYTNVLPSAVDANGNDYKGDNGEDGYRTGYKLSSSLGTEKQSVSYPACVSGYIKIDRYQDTIRIKNIAVSSTVTINNIGFYKADKTYIKGIPGVADAMGNDVAADENGVYIFRPQKWLTSTEGSDIGFFRFSCAEITNETIVTINEEIA